MVDTGQWLLYRYNPDNAKKGQNPFTMDSKDPKKPVKEYLNMEARFKMLQKSRPEVAKILYEQAQINVNERFKFNKYLGERSTEEISKEINKELK
ncbi:MAG: hypothetical protein LH629_05540 [Ignavibacteria bacterium]|nr:hypothetical protein [Ignavibacteria bacterium]